jgi:hypothetical protein
VYTVAAERQKLSLRQFCPLGKTVGGTYNEVGETCYFIKVHSKSESRVRFFKSNGATSVHTATSDVGASSLSASRNYPTRHFPDEYYYETTGRDPFTQTYYNVMLKNTAKKKIAVEPDPKFP